MTNGRAAGRRSRPPIEVSRATVLAADPSDVRAYHERETTFARLAPPWRRFRIRERSGGIATGARTVFEGRVGPVPYTWVAEHVAHDDHGFVDIMRRGPLDSWRHEHRFDPHPDGTLLTDRVRATLPFHDATPSIVRRHAERDVAALLYYRHTVTADDLLDPGSPPMRIAITGASGLIGTRLSQRLRARGHTTIPLVRRAARTGEIRWDPSGDFDPMPLDGVDAVVHLAGESIGASLRWTDETKARILESRVQGTASIARALASLPRPPKVLVSASAVGYYGDGGEHVLDEDSPPGDDFLASVCQAWEAAAEPAREAGIRVVHPRLATVLAAHNGAIRPLVWLARSGLAGPLGDGRQFFPWVSLHDATRALELLLSSEIDGPVNVTAPEPIRQRQFIRTLAGSMRRPAVVPAPAFVLRAALGEIAGLLLSGQRAVPRRLQENNFRWTHGRLADACAGELGATGQSGSMR